MIIQKKIIYLSGIVMTYFLSELIKTSPLTHKNPRNIRKYEHCVNVLLQSVRYVKDVYDMCDTLHVVDDSFNNFTCDLVYLLLYSYALVQNNVHRSLLGVDYWLICNAAVVVYSLMTQCKFFEFSYSSTSVYTDGQVYFNVALCIVLIGALSKQVYQKRANLHMLLAIVLGYTTLYVMIRSVAEVHFHFHHVFICTIILSFFTKFEYRFDRYTHAILMGILVQGFSFFTVNEIFIFSSTDHVSSPTLEYILCLFVISFVVWYLLKRLHKTKKQTEELHIHEYQII